MSIICLRTCDPSGVEPPPAHVSPEEVSKVHAPALVALVGRRGQGEHWEHDETQDGQDDQRGDEHAFPVALAATRGYQLLKEKFDKKALEEIDLRKTM